MKEIDYIFKNIDVEKFLKLIKKNAFGIYNISIGKKIYLKNIIKCESIFFMYIFIK